MPGPMEEERGCETAWTASSDGDLEGCHQAPGSLTRHGTEGAMYSTEGQRPSVGVQW